MHMTYRAMETFIKSMTDEQKDSDVTVYLKGMDEFFAVDQTILISTDDEDDPSAGILDEQHPYVSVTL